jgi:hypothetical protein
MPRFDRSMTTLGLSDAGGSETWLLDGELYATIYATINAGHPVLVEMIVRLNSQNPYLLADLKQPQHRQCQRL